MRQVVLSLSIGLIAGFSLSFLPIGPDGNASGRSDKSPAVASVECVCDLQRSEESDRELQGEREANRRLRTEIDRLRSVVDETSDRTLAMPSIEAGNWLEYAWTDLASGDEAANRKQQLIDAGFPPARADWILSREAELQMAAVEEHYRDPAAGPSDYLESRLTGRQALREEIGDFEYEQFLAATGQSTRVAITQVMADSPADYAGFQVGDEIVDYDGMRVFNMIELAGKAQNGNQGNAVIVNIERDGAPIQIVLPRGPMGISGGRPTRE